MEEIPEAIAKALEYAATSTPYRKVKGHCHSKVCYDYDGALSALFHLKRMGCSTARMYICKDCRTHWVFHITSGALGYWDRPEGNRI